MRHSPVVGARASSSEHRSDTHLFGRKLCPNDHWIRDLFSISEDQRLVFAAYGNFYSVDESAIGDYRGVW